MKHGFSLVELILAVAVVSFGLIALLGLIAVGLGAGKTSVEETTVSLIAQGLFRQVESQVNTTTTFNGIGAGKATFFYFDHNGFSISQSTGQPSLNFFRVTANIAPMDSSNYPSGPSGGKLIDASQMLAVTLTFQWPVQAVANGSPIPNARKAVYTYYVAKATEPGWP